MYRLSLRHVRFSQQILVQKYTLKHSNLVFYGQYVRLEVKNTSKYLFSSSCLFTTHARNLPGKENHLHKNKKIRENIPILSDVSDTFLNMTKRERLNKLKERLIQNSSQKSIQLLFEAFRDLPIDKQNIIAHDMLRELFREPEDLNLLQFFVFLFKERSSLKIDLPTMFNDKFFVVLGKHLKKGIVFKCDERLLKLTFVGLLNYTQNKSDKTINSSQYLRDLILFNYSLKSALKAQNHSPLLFMNTFKDMYTLYLDQWLKQGELSSSLPFLISKGLLGEQSKYLAKIKIKNNVDVLNLHIMIYLNKALNIDITKYLTKETINSTQALPYFCLHLANLEDLKPIKTYLYTSTVNKFLNNFKFLVQDKVNNEKIILKLIQNISNAQNISILPNNLQIQHFKALMTLLSHYSVEHKWLLRYLNYPIFSERLGSLDEKERTSLQRLYSDHTENFLLNFDNMVAFEKQIKLIQLPGGAKSVLTSPLLEGLFRVLSTSFQNITSSKLCSHDELSKSERQRETLLIKNSFLALFNLMTIFDSSEINVNFYDELKKDKIYTTKTKVCYVEFFLMFIKNLHLYSNIIDYFKYRDKDIYRISTKILKELLTNNNIFRDDVNEDNILKAIRILQLLVLDKQLLKDFMTFKHFKVELLNFMVNMIVDLLSNESLASASKLEGVEEDWRDDNLINNWKGFLEIKAEHYHRENVIELYRKFIEILNECQGALKGDKYLKESIFHVHSLLQSRLPSSFLQEIKERLEEPSQSCDSDVLKLYEFLR